MSSTWVGVMLKVLARMESGIPGVEPKRALATTERPACWELKADKESEVHEGTLLW